VRLPELLQVSSHLRSHHRRSPASVRAGRDVARLCRQSATPPGYQYIEKARPRSESALMTTLTNHGGLCLFYASFLGAREISLPVYKSGMEVLAVYVHGARRNALVIVIYRPGSTAPTTEFFDHHHHHHFRLMIMVDKRIHTIDNKNRRKMVRRPTR